MQLRQLGDTGLTVSAVALGCGALGDARLSERESERLVLGALDLGVTLFDSARSYGLSEERLGRILRGREAVRSTKGGYGIEGASDWSPEAVLGGIDERHATIDVPKRDHTTLKMSTPMAIETTAVSANDRAGVPSAAVIG